MWPPVFTKGAALRPLAIRGSQVEVIHSPRDFYDTILTEIRRANNRVVLSSLYLGVGDLERAIVDALDQRLSVKPGLKVQILLDALRGERRDRSGESSVSLLSRIADKAQICLWRTPDHPWLVDSLPERTRELVGVQHMKIYVFDNTTLISGANLSHSYFSDRQDRYIVIRDCPALADFLSNVVSAISSCSFRVSPGGRALELHPDCVFHPVQRNAEYRKMVRDRVGDVKNTWNATQAESAAATASDTLIYPVLQMAPFGIHDELTLADHLFGNKDAASMWLASGYFTYMEQHVEKLLKEATAELDVLIPSPQANGFWGAGGLSRHVPSLYVNESRKLHSAMLTSIAAARLWEWIPHSKGWTFHAKGVWLDAPSWSATLVGSSNFGFRSARRDLEAQLLLVTKDGALRQRLEAERKHLWEHAELVEEATFRRPDHVVPTLVAALSRFLRYIL